MAKHVFEVKRERFHLIQPDKYLVWGIFPKDYKLTAYLDDREIEAEKDAWENMGVMERFYSSGSIKGNPVEITVNLPEDLVSYKKLYLYASAGGEKDIWFTMPVKTLVKRQGKPQYHIEEVNIDRERQSLSIRGWAAGQKPVAIRLFDEHKNPINCQISHINRVDVTELYTEVKVEPKCGFYLELPHTDSKRVYLVFKEQDGEKAVFPIGMRRVDAVLNKADLYLEKSTRYLSTYGMTAFLKKAASKVKNLNQGPVDYGKWLPKHLPSKGQLEEQRKTEFGYQPKISLVVPVYRTPSGYLQKMIESVQVQTYSNWELCISDGSGSGSPVKEILQRYAESDSRIRIVEHEIPLKISENTNAAIKIATGDFIAFMDHDDVILPHAFYECVKALNDDCEIQVLYSDEDKMTMDGNKFFQPHFKPDFNLDLLCTVNYICHLFVAKRDVIEQVGMLRSEYDGAQDYDFVLRCVEYTDKIHHIPRILYHWRSHEDSTAENPESKGYAYDAGQRAVQAHYDRIGVKAEVFKGEYPGLYRTKFLREEDPMISIIIPNKDHITDLKRCMNSIFEKSAYRNFEFVIVENNSSEEETFSYYKELENCHENVKVVQYDGIFNYSKINNYGARAANGQYFLLLNNDTEIINPDCLEELLGYCTREDVGIVGARMYYPDDTIQHAGVVIGFGGIAGHCFVQQKRGYSGYFERVICAQNYSAVTAACMLVKREVFEAVGGLSEELAVAFNDIDFCLKVRELGKLVVYNPYAELYHYESKSRGLEDTPEKISRFNKEIITFQKKWPDILRDGDPYYNPNLTLESQDFSLRRI